MPPNPNTEAMAEQLFEALAGYVARAVAPLHARLAKSEKALADAHAQIAAMAASDLPEPIDVRAITDEIRASLTKDLDVACRDAVAALPLPEKGDPGKSVTVTDVAPMIVEEVARAVAAIPVLPPPTLPDPADIAATVRADIQGDIKAAAAESVAALPLPEKGDPGKNVSVDDVAPLIVEEVARAVAAIPAPKDGVGLAGAMIDRDGDLVVTLTNGEIKALGPVCGTPGTNGVDGLGFDDLSVEADGDRGVVLRFDRGEQRKQFRLQFPVMIYRDVYQDGRAYEKGDAVTWGGSLWAAVTDTSAKPRDDNRDWRLVAKKGRDGKAGDPGRHFDGTSGKVTAGE